MLIKQHRVLMDAANGDGSDAGGDAAAAAAAAAAAGGDKGGDKGETAEPSLLAKGADAAALAAAAAAKGDKAGDKGKLKEDPLAWLPEKFRVKKDGTDEVDVEASAKKGLGSLAELERRMKDTGLPPETAEKYEFKPPAGAEKLEFDAAMTAAAKKHFHELGLTQKQYQGVMDLYVKNLGQFVERGLSLGAERATAELTKSWGQPDTPQFKGNLALAHKAFMAFADEADQKAMDQIGNSPIVLRVLAKIGRELQEDTSVEGHILPGESIDALMKDKAYWNERDPRHAEVKAKVMRHFEAQAAAEQRRAAAA